VQDGGDQPLQVHGGCGEIGLDLHVGEATPDGTRKAMPGFGLAMDAFDPDAVTAVERPFALTPAGVFPSGPQQGGVILVQQDGPPLHVRAEANGPKAASPAVRDPGAVVLEAVTVRLAMGAEDLAAGTADQAVSGVQLEAAHGDGAPLGRPLGLGWDDCLDAALLQIRKHPGNGVAGVHGRHLDGCAGRGGDGIKLLLDRFGVVYGAGGDHDVEDDAVLGIGCSVLLVGRLATTGLIVGRQRGVRVSGAYRRLRFRSHRLRRVAVSLSCLDRVNMAPGDGVPAHIRPDQGAVDVHDLALGDPGRHAGLDGAGENAPEALGAPALADAGQAGVVGQGLMQAVANEPANGEIDLGFTDQPPVMHDPQQQARQHQPYRDLRVNARSASLAAIQRLDLCPQPAKVEDAVYSDQNMLVGEQGAERACHEQLRLPSLPSCQHRHLRLSGDSQSKHDHFFNRPERMT
jgi:hypothetical protein